jgi:hypothetical protein
MAKNAELRAAMLAEYGPEVASGAITEADAIACVDASCNVPIAGWRDGWLERVVLNAPKHGAYRKAYVSALYALRAEVLPAAFVRADDTARFQGSIDVAIATIERYCDELTHAPAAGVKVRHGRGTMENPYVPVWDAEVSHA